MARRDQETDQTISPPTAAAIQYRGPAGATLTASVSYVPVSQSRTTYQTLSYTDPETGERRTADVVARRESETTSVLAAINGTLCKSYLEAGISPNLSAPGFQRTIVVSTNEVGRDGPRVRQEVADEFLSQFAFAGQIGIQNYVIDETPVILSNSLIHVTRTITEFQVDEDAGVTKTLTTRYLAWGMTAEGRDLAAAIATQATTVGEVQDLIRAMTQFVCDGTKVQIFTGRDYGVQTRGTEQSDARNKVFGLRGGSLASGGSGGSFNVGLDGTTLQFAFGPPPAGFDRSTRFQRGVPRVLNLQWGLPTTDPPAGPEPDDTWIDASTDTPNVWDGDGWTPVLPDPPEDPAEGDTWRQDGTGVSFIWRAGTWVPYTPRPVGYGMAQAGAIWYEARGQVLYVWSGTAWIPYADTAPAGPSVGDRYVEAATGIERSWGGSSWGATGNTWPRFTTTAPASPAIGAVWIDRNTVTPKRWDGTGWQPFTPTRPTQAAPGDSWVDATTGEAFVWSGTTWVPYTTTPPSSPAPGDTYVNPTTGVERRWNGSAWSETGRVFGSLIAEDIEAQPLDALRAEEIDLPFPNDDTVAVEVAPGGALRRWLLPGEVQQQATDMAELENGIRYGTANGANVVVEAWQMPSAALAPFTVRAGGLEVQYLADGHVWEFDGELLAASCDGILCGAAARLPDEPLVPWVAGQGDLRALPAAAAPEVDALALPANTIATPAGFNPAIPGGIWNLLPTNGVDTFALTSTPSMVLLGFAVMEDDQLVVRGLLSELEVDYSLLPVDEGSDAVTVQTVLTEEENQMTIVNLPVSTLTLSAPEPQIYSPADVNLPLSTLSLTAPELTASASVVTVQLPLTILSLASTAPTVSAVGPSDPNFSSVSLLLPCDGANNSTTFTDASTNNVALTVFGNAKLSTTQAKWGATSASFDGSGSFLRSMSNAAIFDFTSGSFSVELWFYQLASKRAHLISYREADWRLEVGTGQELYWVTPFAERITTVTGVAPLNQWNFVQAISNGTTTTLNVNGTSRGSTTEKPLFGAGPSAGIYIGRNPATTLRDFNGFMDDIRVNKGVVRGSTVPTGPFPTS